MTGQNVDDRCRDGCKSVSKNREAVKKMRFLTPLGFGMTGGKKGNNIARHDDNKQLHDAEVPRQNDKKQMTLSFRA